MDVGNLRIELEQHLNRNPDKDAPGGFRDRFDTIAEQHAAEEDDIPKSVLAGLLRQVRNEAEAAANAAAIDSAPDVRVGASGAAPRESGGAVDAAGDTATAPSPGLLQRYGIVLVVILIVLVAAFLYFR
jgi:hypothetical protein